MRDSGEKQVPAELFVPPPQPQHKSDSFALAVFVRSSIFQRCEAQIEFADGPSGRRPMLLARCVTAAPPLKQSQTQLDECKRSPAFHAVLGLCSCGVVRAAVMH